MTDSKGIRFSKSVIKQFHNLVEKPATIQKRVSMLEDMEDLFEEDIFLYADTESRILGMKYLLGTWEIVIHDVKNLRTRDQYVIYRIITKICARKEFFIETCDFDVEHMTVAPHFLPLLKKFADLLSITFVYCQSLLHDTISSIPVLFASKILSVCYYRLPTVHHLLNYCLLNLYPSSLLQENELNQIYIVNQSSPKSAPLPKSRSLLQLSTYKEPPADLSLPPHDGDQFSERSIVTVDFSKDIILTASEPPTPSPGPLESQYSPIPEFDSLDVKTLQLLEEIPVKVDEVKVNELDIPGLRVKNYVKSIDRRIHHERNAVNQSTLSLLKMKLPSLFYWMRIVGEDSVETEDSSWWLERMRVCDSLLFDVIRCRFDIVDDYQRFAKTNFVPELFPCYYLFLRCFLPSFQHAILQKYNCGTQRRNDTIKASDYLSSGLKTSCYYLRDPKVTNMLFEMVMSECNVFVVSDISQLYVYLDTWCSALVKLTISRSDDSRETLLEGVHHYLSLHPNSNEIELIEYLVLNEFCCDSSEARNAINVFKHDSILLLSEGQLVIQTLFPPFEDHEKPYRSFHLSFPYFTLFASLQAILQQNQLLVLKRGLLFIYNHYDIFIGNYRYFFYTQIFSEFSRLFSHWDRNVRLVFHNLLLYRCLISLQREIPHLTSEQLLSFIDEEQLEKIAKMQFGASKQSKSNCASFMNLYRKWKKSKKSTNSVMYFPSDSCSFMKHSIQSETLSIDAVLASKIDSYILMAISELNQPTKYKVPRNRYFNLFSSIAEYVLLLVDYERKEKKIQSRGKLKAPVFDTSFILRDPNQQK